METGTMKKSPEIVPSIAQAIHYPECWDTAAYPTVEDALRELYAWFKCSNEECTRALTAAVTEIEVAQTYRDMQTLGNVRGVGHMEALQWSKGVSDCLDHLLSKYPERFK
jgi:hypothetical protein